MLSLGTCRHWAVVVDYRLTGLGLVFPTCFSLWTAVLVPHARQHEGQDATGRRRPSSGVRTVRPSIGSLAQVSTPESLWPSGSSASSAASPVGSGRVLWQTLSAQPKLPCPVPLPAGNQRNQTHILSSICWRQRSGRVGFSVSTAVDRWLALGDYSSRLSRAPQERKQAAVAPNSAGCHA